MSKIVKGYKGIIDLDLTNVPSHLHQVMIDQHIEDIKNYKEEQSKLPVKLRYENTVIRAQKIRELEDFHLKKRKEEALIKQKEEDKIRLETFNRIEEMKIRNSQSS